MRARRNCQSETCLTRCRRSSTSAEFDTATWYLFQKVLLEEGNNRTMLTRRSFINLAGASALGIAAFALPGCGESRRASQSSSASATSAPESPTFDEAASQSSSASASSAPESPTLDGVAPSSAPSSQAGAISSAASTAAATAESLVVYFSRAGENYDVGYIEEGNTAILAKMIVEATDADLFEVVPTEAYPEGYDECCDVALAEQNAAARPAFEGGIDIAPYKTVYLGYPIWWGDLPMCLYTFLEAHDWAGKEIRPFCTHAGSGLAGTTGSIQAACAGASIGQGLSIAGTTAQNSRDEARSAVDSWLG